MSRRIASDLVSEGLNPDWRRGWILYRLNAWFQTQVWPGRDGIDVEAADWDSLIVCDACRYDLFTESEAPGWFHKFDKVTSRSSTTSEWLYQNFPNSYADTVYVAGNPMVSKHRAENFHCLIEAWRDAWNAEENIISAKAVTEAAIQAREEYPNKRLVVHYMQPHAPFYDHPDLQFTNYADFDEINPDTNEGAGNVWDAVQQGIVTIEEVWQGYLDTLEYVLPEVEKVLNDDRMGRSIVTSDHGNVFPTRSFPIPIQYSGHPIGHRTKRLVVVPWGIREADDRPKITSGSVGSETNAGNDELKKQLEALGYT